MFVRKSKLRNTALVIALFFVFSWANNTKQLDALNCILEFITSWKRDLVYVLQYVP